MYPNQPRQQDGWPAQPPQHTERPSVQAGQLPRRRRRGRGWIVALGLLAVLVVLLVIADQVAKAYAQNMIASKLQSSSGLSAKPSVTIEGFPFLTQVAAHNIGAIDLSASDVQAGKLDISSVKARATGVHLNSSFNSATTDQITGTALIRFDALASATGAQGVTITADPAGGPNAVKVSVGPLTATAFVSFSDLADAGGGGGPAISMSAAGPDRVKITAGIGPLSDTEVAKISQTGPNQISIQVQNGSSPVSGLLNAFGSFSFSIPRLPASVHITGFAVTSQGLTLAAAADHAILTKPSS